jgi:flagellin
MIGPMSSSLALAQRTATKARATMDTMARQIATGQKVSSVKDDGAAWARANSLKGQITQGEARNLTLERIQGGLKVTEAMLTPVLEAVDRLRNLAVEAGGTAPGSTARTSLQAEWNQVVESVAHPSMVNPFFETAWVGHAYQANGIGGTLLSSSDPITNGMVVSISPTAQGFYEWFAGSLPVSLRGFDVANANSAQLSDALAATAWVRSGAVEWSRTSGGQQQMLARVQDNTVKDNDRLRTALSSLTDADLGKVSTARAQAGTRQQLALQTIQQAISAYGNFAGGLLGNVQRTQRGMLA